MSPLSALRGHSAAEEWFFVDDLAVGVSHDEPFISCHVPVLRQIARHGSSFVAGGVIVREFLPLDVAGTRAVHMEKVAWHREAN